MSQVAIDEGRAKGTCALTLPEHATCRHWWYGLTCRQFEVMLTACGQRCELCRGAATGKANPKLVIDHDAYVGRWAVRGLLCQHCNGKLRYDRPAPAAARTYLADPWYRRMLRERGLEQLPPEPSHSRAMDFFDRLWFRWSGGWSTGHKRCPDLSWARLVAMYGPHNLTPVADTAQLTVIRGRVIA